MLSGDEVQVFCLSIALILALYFVLNHGSPIPGGARIQHSLHIYLLERTH